MKAVWKYHVSMEPFSHNMPEGARPLCVQNQNGGPQMWALVDPTRPRVTRQFITVGTGHEHDADDLYDWCHVGTFQMFGGELIFHVFEIGPKTARRMD